jgi:DNA-binding transcriptional regulator YiaG
MTPAEVRAARKALGLSQVAMAQVVGVTPRTITHWEAGSRNVPEPAARLIRSLENARRD